MSKLKIGILGCTINNSNMGCMALTYSLLNLLQEICEEKKTDVDYYILSGGGFGNDSKGAMELINNINIDKEQLHILPEITWEICGVYKTLRTMKKIPIFCKIYNIIKKCDFVIDLTQGDSFSDIYGKERFYNWTFSKRLVEWSKVPLILGPQTYGPFEDSKVRKRAKKTIENAQLVIARDSLSKEYVQSFCSVQVKEGIDLAFFLPYSKKNSASGGKIKIGINPSGLLCNDKTDSSKLSLEMKTDFDEYLKMIVQWIERENKYELHIISHVGNEARKCFNGIKGAIYHPEFSNPIEAKNCIADLDIFIGARMHATIAAFSSNVATIPVAYSRKFTGLYHGIGYEFIIDLCHMTTDQAVEQTIEYIKDSNMLRRCAMESMKQVEENYTQMKGWIEEFMDEVIL